MIRSCVDRCTRRRGAAVATAVPVLLAVGAAGAGAQEAARPGSGAGSDRYFFAPTARMPPAGTVEVGALMIGLPYLTYSPGARLSVTAGTPLFALVSRDEFARYWYVSPKVQLLERGPLAAAVGSWTVLDLTPDAAVHAALWTVMTVGDDDRSVSLGLAGGAGDLSAPAILLAGIDYRLPLGSRPDGVQVRIVAEWHAARRRSASPIGVLGFRIHDDRYAIDLATGTWSSGTRGRKWIAPLINVAYRF